jgi:hypothetical protein
MGSNDQLGAANLITEAKRRQAVALARLGRVVHPFLTASSAEGEIHSREMAAHLNTP